MVFCAVAYIATGAAAYEAYGMEVRGDLLESFPNISIALIARIAIVLNVVGSFPLYMHPTRKSLCQILWNKDVNEIPRKTYVFLNVAAVFACAAAAIANRCHDAGLQ